MPELCYCIQCTRERAFLKEIATDVLAKIDIPSSYDSETGKTWSVRKAIEEIEHTRRANEIFAYPWHGFPGADMIVRYNAPKPIQPAKYISFGSFGSDEYSVVGNVHDEIILEKRRTDPEISIMDAYSYDWLVQFDQPKGQRMIKYKIRSTVDITKFFEWTNADGKSSTVANSKEELQQALPQVPADQVATYVVLTIDDQQQTTPQSTEKVILTQPIANSINDMVNAAITATRAEYKNIRSALDLLVNARDVGIGIIDTSNYHMTGPMNAVLDDIIARAAKLMPLCASTKTAVTGLEQALKLK
jgi:hypothetical protein